MYQMSAFEIFKTREVWWLFCAACCAAVYAFFYIRRLIRQRDSLLQAKQVVYQFVHDVSEAFVQADEVSVDDLLKRVLVYAQRICRAGAGAIYFLDDSGIRLRARAVSGLFPPMSGDFDAASWEKSGGRLKRLVAEVRERYEQWGEGLVGRVAERGAPALIEDPDRDTMVPKYASDLLAITSALLVPMRFRNSVMGVVVLINRIDDRPFTQEDMSLLQALADQASFTLYFMKFNEELGKKRLMDYDMMLARNIQTALLPKKLPDIEGVEIAAFSLPAYEVGGDYYDIVEVDQDHIGIAVADVSGKGVTGAMMMSICRSVFRAHAPGCLSPARVLAEINDVITQDIYEDMFISMSYAVLNKRTFEITLARAGQCIPFVVSEDGTLLRRLSPRGMAIGMGDAETFKGCMEETSALIEEGETFVSYTDGIPEAVNERHEQWSVARLERVAGAHAREGAARIVECVRDELCEFFGDMPHNDDMTLVVMRRKEQEQRTEDDQQENKAWR